jgi:ABC transport system ATP-binding/permease protein
MALLSLQGVSFDHGGPMLLDRADFSIEEGERLALVGRNGTGKSTLLALLAGELVANEGVITRKKGLRTGTLPQTPATDMPGTVGDLVRRGVRRAGHGGWMEERRFAEIVETLALEPQSELRTLSAGLLRRTLLGATIAEEPDLLLLDEPTNHLDIVAVRAVEEIVRGFNGAVMYVTHDRRFVQATATAIVELDRGRLVRYPGRWQDFLERRESLLEAEEKARAEFEKTLAQEEAWLRRGVKARRARNMGRVHRLVAMREEHRARRQRSASAEMRAQSADRSGALVVRARHLGFAYAQRPIVESLDLDLMRGDRLGIVGPNGCGKSTLVRLLLGEIAPTTGEIRHGTGLAISWFDQHQEQLDHDVRVQDAVADGATAVTLDGEPRHVISYLADFLFTPEQCRSSVRKLSGGERNRLLLARLFARPSNVLVLDEPTNDLDIETLEVLENVIAEYQGTLILVSHDRAFLDNVVSSLLVHEEGGRWKEYDGGYADYERVRAASEAPVATERPRAAREASAPESDKKRRFGNKERKELEELPRRIESLEAQQAALHERMADPALFKTGGAQISAIKSELDAIERELPAAYARWEELLALE